MLSKKYEINQDRLWNTLMTLGEIGRDENEGVTRVSLSPEDLKAREYVIQLMREIGLEVRVDEVGNIIGRLVGKDVNAPVVMAGSHIDTVFQGGQFDGALGVLSAIEAVRTIKESGIELTHSIDVISFTDEEGARFDTGFIGSKGLIGELTVENFAIRDANGNTYREAFVQAGLNPDQYLLAKRNPEEIKAYVEMHIEQGRVLETEDLPVGIVTDIQGPVWMYVSYKGHADHAGATPMSIRIDASLAMAEVLPIIERIAIKWKGVATVGKMEFIPGGVNIIPEEVNFTIDFRHVDKKIRQHMKEKIIDALHLAAKKRGLDVQIEIKVEVDPASCSTEIIRTIEEACWESNLPVYKMKCGAGHDALLMSKITKFGMIFVRSSEGISHNPKEWSSKEDCQKGTEVLYRTLIHLAK